MKNIQEKRTKPYHGLEWVGILADSERLGKNPGWALGSTLFTLQPRSVCALPILCCKNAARADAPRLPGPPRLLRV